MRKVLIIWALLGALAAATYDRYLLQKDVNLLMRELVDCGAQKSTGFVLSDPDDQCNDLDTPEAVRNSKECQ